MIRTEGILNLRLTCRALERQTYDYFCNSFKDETQFLSLDSALCDLWHSNTQPWRTADVEENNLRKIRGYDSFLADNPEVAKLTTSLGVLQHRRRMAGEQASSNVNMVNVLSKLPNLQNLTIRNFSRSEMRDYLPLSNLKLLYPESHGRAYQIDHLELANCTAPAAHIAALIEVISPRSLAFHAPSNYTSHVGARDFWKHVLPVLQKIEHLEVFRFFGKELQHITHLDAFGYNFHFGDAEKGYYGTVTDYDAFIQGRTAIKIGLKHLQSLIER